MDLASGETNGGDWMYGFGYGKRSWKFGETAERGAWVGGLALLLLKSVVHCKRTLAAESER